MAPKKAVVKKIQEASSVEKVEAEKIESKGRKKQIKNEVSGLDYRMQYRVYGAGYKIWLDNKAEAAEAKF